MPQLNTFIALLVGAVSLLALPAAEGFLVPPTSSSISTSSLSAAKDGVKADVPRPRRRRIKSATLEQQPRRRRLSRHFQMVCAVDRWWYCRPSRRTDTTKKTMPI